MGLTDRFLDAFSYLFCLLLPIINFLPVACKSNGYKKSTGLLMAYSLVELLIQLKTETTINNLGNEANIITAFFKPFIGDFGLYLSPHFVMTHFFLPLTILLLIFMSFLVFVQKKWSQSISLFLYGNRA